MSQLSNSIPENCPYYKEQKMDIGSCSLIAANSQYYHQFKVNEKLNSQVLLPSRSLIERRIKKQLDDTLLGLENAPLYLVLPKTQMKLITFMYENQTRELERLTRKGFEYFENMVKLMTFPIFPTQSLNYDFKEKETHTISYEQKLKLVS